MTCASDWCERPSLADRTGNLFELPDRLYCCTGCRAADEGDWHERDDWGEDADHEYGCKAA